MYMYSAYKDIIHWSNDRIYALAYQTPTTSFITLDQGHRPIILLPTLRKVIDHSDRENSHKDDARPVHRLCSHRSGSRPESEEPERKDEANSHDVDCKSGLAERPSPRWQRSPVQTSPNEASDNDQIGTEDGNCTKRRD
jgi:hypothetical protein